MISEGLPSRMGAMTAQVDMQRVALASLALPCVGRKTAIDILAAAPETLDSVADFAELVHAAGKARTSRLGIDDLTSALDRAVEQLNAAAAEDIAVITIRDSRYPDHLRSIPDPPAVLFARGRLDGLERPALAIIGTREPTDFGQRAAHRMAMRCAEAGVVVVSGLAKGCDAAAHQGCVDAEGVTIAVLAHGVDSVHPVANRALADQILDRGGCLVSEYSLGEKPRRNYFVERDRIQSALSRAVLVVETDIKGGTMHTVNFAKKQGRAVACLVHPSRYSSEPKTQGNQKLIREDSAVPVGSAEDLMALLERVQNGDHKHEGSDTSAIQLELWGAAADGGDSRP